MWSQPYSQHPGQGSGSRTYFWYLCVDTPESQVSVPLSALETSAWLPREGKSVRRGLSEGWPVSCLHHPAGTPPGTPSSRQGPRRTQSSSGLPLRAGGPARTISRMWRPSLGEGLRGPRGLSGPYAWVEEIKP